MIHIFTITARNYLSLALTLGDSVALHHPEANFTICISDGLKQLDGLLSATTHSGHRVLSAYELMSREQLEDLAFKYNITEYCTAIKPILFKTLFEDPEVDLVYYLDPDTCLYHRLDQITEDSPNKTLYLAPHLIDCRIADDHPYPEYHHLWEGIFNLGFCAIRRTEATQLILDWWDARLRDYCFADHADGLHTDQKWMDYAPVFFHDELEVVRHYGVNTAHWNLGERAITERGGHFFANGDSLIFFHFSGFDFNGKLLSKHTLKDKQLPYLQGPLLDLSNNYRERVWNNNYYQFIKIPYAFAYFDNGKPITSLHRRLYRVLSKETPIVMPFSSSETFYMKLRVAGLLDESKEALGNYSAATVRNLGRVIGLAERMLRGFRLIFGTSRYVQLIRFFSRYSRYESHVFFLREKD